MSLPTASGASFHFNFVGDTQKRFPTHHSTRGDRRRGPQRARFSRAGVETPSSVRRSEAPQRYDWVPHARFASFAKLTWDPRAQAVSAAYRDNMGTTPKPSPAGTAEFSPGRKSGVSRSEKSFPLEGRSRSAPRRQLQQRTPLRWSDGEPGCPILARSLR